MTNTAIFVNFSKKVSFKVSSPSTNESKVFCPSKDIMTQEKHLRFIMMMMIEKEEGDDIDNDDDDKKYDH